MVKYIIIVEIKENEILVNGDTPIALFKFEHIKATDLYAYILGHITSGIRYLQEHERDIALALEGAKNAEAEEMEEF